MISRYVRRFVVLGFVVLLGVLLGCSHAPAEGTDPSSGAAGATEAVKQSPPVSPAAPVAPPTLPAPAVTAEAPAPATPAREVVLVYGGELRGYVRPCKCTDGMIGGICRKNVYLRKLRANSKGPVLSVDIGNFVQGPGLQRQYKLSTILANLDHIGGADGLTLGSRDLSLDRPFLASELAHYVEKLPFLSANVKVEDLEEVLRPFRRTVVSGLEVFITAVIDPELVAGMPGVSSEDALEALARLAPEAESADLRILLAHADTDTCRNWVRAVSSFDVVVGGVGEENPSPPETIGETLFVTPGIWGKYGLALTMKRREGAGWTGSLVKTALTEEGGADPDCRNMLVEYQRMLSASDEITLASGPHPGGAFAGSKSCAACHERAYEIYVKSKHHEALETLKKEGTASDPECLICHVVGYGYDTGFTTVQATAELSGVGCESCHGPGARHVESEDAADISRGGDENCRTCHTPIQSPAFDYEEFFHSIAHPEKEGAEGVK